MTTRGGPAITKPRTLDLWYFRSMKPILIILVVNQRTLAEKIPVRSATAEKLIFFLAIDVEYHTPGEGVLHSVSYRKHQRRDPVLNSI